MIIKLDNRSLIEISGVDGSNFLQSQFSNDIKSIKQDQIQLNAYCQHQGKVIAIIWVSQIEDNYYLSIPNDLKDLLIARLNMFKLMSQVKIEDISSSIKQYGLINENLNSAFKLRNNISILFSKEELSTGQSLSLWEEEAIKNTLPEIYLDTSEKYIPQVLNLDLDEFGVSFSKGCYPGQEVVARMHYLGKPKRRLYRFSSKFKAHVGDSLNVAIYKSLKASGEVLRVVESSHLFYFLGTLEVDYIKDTIFLNGNPDIAVEILLDE